MASSGIDFTFPGFETLREFLATNQCCGPDQVLVVLHCIWPQHYPLTGDALKALIADMTKHGCTMDPQGMTNIPNLDHYFSLLGVKHTTIGYGKVKLDTLHAQLRTIEDPLQRAIYLIETSQAGVGLHDDERNVKNHYFSVGGIKTNATTAAGDGYYRADGDASENPARTAGPPILTGWSSIAATAPIGYIIVPPQGAMLPKPASPKPKALTVAQARKLAVAAGFSTKGDPAPADIAVAIAQAESGLHPDATNTAGNTPPSTDRGIMQINSYWHPEVTDAQAFDPASAFKAAFVIAKQGTDFSPWATYTSGAYRKFLSAQAPAPKAPAPAPKPPASEPPTSVPPAPVSNGEQPPMPVPITPPQPLPQSKPPSIFQQARAGAPLSPAQRGMLKFLKVGGYALLLSLLGQAPTLINVLNGQSPSASLAFWGQLVATILTPVVVAVDHYQSAQGDSNQVPNGHVVMSVLGQLLYTLSSVDTTTKALSNPGATLPEAPAPSGAVDGGVVSNI